ncbi:MAG: hypothetical protein GY716_01380 [bacterium]|nr:hypothetical protein [bacterium]
MREHRRSVVSVACAAALLVAYAGLVSAEEGRIPIFEPVVLDGTTSNISGNYVVTRDITAAIGTSVIRIIGNGTDQNVEIDLNGFTLTTVNGGLSVIEVTGLENFTMRNGSVVGGDDDEDTVFVTGTDGDEDLVIVEDVKIKGGDEGLYLDKVTNFAIRRNLVVETLGSGIRVADSASSSDQMTGIIEDNVVRDTAIGIEFRWTNRSATIRNNQIVNPFDPSRVGLRVRYGRSTVIVGNNISGGGTGIEIGDSGVGPISGCEECTIAENNVSDSDATGIELYNCDECTIKDNLASSNGEHGLDMNDSDRCFIQGNQFNRNDTFGIYLRDNSDGNSYGNNVLRDNDADLPAATCTGVPASPCASPAVCDETGLDPAVDADANRSFGDNMVDAPGTC